MDWNHGPRSRVLERPEECPGPFASREGGSVADPVSVLVADHQPIVVQGLEDLIARDGKLRFAGSASNGDEVFDLFMRVRPDVVVLDILMPTLDGIEAIRRIREIDRDAGVMVFTSFDGEGEIQRAFHAGAMAYLLKDAPRQDVRACITAVSEGRKYLAPDVGSKLANWLSSEALSSRELQILRLVAQGHCNKVVARKADISVGTTKSHLKHIFRKLGVTSRTAAANAAIKRGVVKL